MGVARQGKCCVEGGALRGRGSVARKEKCCADVKALRGRQSVAWKGKCCVEGKALRGRRSVAWKGERCVAWEMQVQATSCALGATAHELQLSGYYKHSGVKRKGGRRWSERRGAPLYKWPSGYRCLYGPSPLQGPIRGSTLSA
ncbi:hypothetical protein VFPBJ_11482 [Purpureocillium lilacinum]|uniref:Uncharacterized protein n=1 Tax=Purpureocillium lilacinum TaxID=33203 RepID=A0A179F769_PURLI|nr:hypothetical protein VFPBJ_11482 [Purpureocillium lilacinum]